MARKLRTGTYGRKLREPLSAVNLSSPHPARLCWLRSDRLEDQGQQLCRLKYDDPQRLRRQTGGYSGLDGVE